MSFVRDQCAIMSQLQIDMAREFASVPPPLSPVTLSNANESQAFPSSNKDSVAALIPVSQSDEE